MIDAVYNHRKNRDNTWDSICPHCALIIARVDEEGELTMHERLHVCDPAIFRRPAPIDYRIFLHSFQR